MRDCPAEKHDTRWAYTRYGCRCVSAVEANAMHNRASNGRRKVIRGTRPPGRGRVANPRLDMSRVREAIAGQQVELTSRELAAALDLYDVGRSAAEVARQLGCTTRTVQRRRAARRCPQAVSTVVDNHST